MVQTTLLPIELLCYSKNKSLLANVRQTNREHFERLVEQTVTENVAAVQRDFDLLPWSKTHPSHSHFIHSIRFLPRDALQCKARSCDRTSSVRL